MSHKNKQNKSKRLKLLLAFVVVFALLGGVYFGYVSFAASDTKRSVFVASGIRNESGGNKDKTGVSISSPGGKFRQDSEFTVYKNSTRDGRESDLTFTDERVDFENTKPRQVRVCANARDWRPFGVPAKVMPRIRYSAKQSALTVSLEPKTSFAEVCSDWQTTDDTNYLELDQVVVNEGVASIHSVTWEWRP